MSATETLAAIRAAGLLVTAEGDALTIAGGGLTDELRQAIREHKLELLALLAGEAEARAEAEAMAFADTDEADEPLGDLMRWFDGLHGPHEILARCRHVDNPRGGSWHWRAGRLRCRWCAICWADRSPVAEPDDTLKAKSFGAVTPKLF